MQTINLIHICKFVHVFTLFNLKKYQISVIIRGIFIYTKDEIKL